VQGWHTGIIGRSPIDFSSRNPLQRAVAWDGDVMTELYLGKRGEARDASFDGSVIVGTTDANAFRYENDTLTRLTQFEEGFVFLTGQSKANAVSADGAVVVGLASPHNFSATGPVMWKDGEQIFIESCSGSIRNLTPDGATLVGYGHCGTSTPFTNPRLDPLQRDTPPTGYLWQDGQIEELGERFFPNAISRDGFIIAGRLPDCIAPINAPEACIIVGENAAIWRDGTLQLLPMPEADNFATATALSADGTQIAGHSSERVLFLFDSSHPRAVLWTEDSGFTPVILDDLLDANSVDRNGFHLKYANAMSEDGTVIVGSGHYPGGKQLGYVLRLRKPPEWDQYPFHQGVRHAGEWLGEKLIKKAGHAWERQRGKR
jgi:uncharacterized membrane protein